MENKAINELQEEIEHLKIENYVLRELIPAQDCTNPIAELYSRLQKALAEAIVLRDEYSAAYKSLILLGVEREKEYNDLMAEVKKSIEESKAMRNSL